MISAKYHRWAGIINENGDPILIGTNKPAHQQMEALRNDGFHCVVSCTENDDVGESCRQNGMESIFIPWYNFSWTSISNKNLTTIATRVAYYLSNKQKVAVHCYGGVGRTASFIAVVWKVLCAQYKIGFETETIVDRLRMVGPPQAVDSAAQYEALFRFYLGGAKDDLRTEHFFGNPMSTMKKQQEYHRRFRNGLTLDSSHVFVTEHVPILAHCPRGHGSFHYELISIPIPGPQPRDS
jgi:hypothetical protein